MKTREFTDLLLLAALWGASFLFMRVAVPEFGPVPLVALRVAIAALVLLPLVAWRGELAQLRTHGTRLALLGALNSALPFVLLSYATLTVTAGFAAILNATTPLWTAAIGALWLRDRVTRAQWVGLGLGLVGVTVLVWGKAGLSPGSQEWAVTLAVLAALLATACYCLAAHVSRRLGDTIAPLPMAAGSQVGSTLLLAPLAFVLWPSVTPGAAAWGSARSRRRCCLAAPSSCSAPGYRSSWWPGHARRSPPARVNATATTRWAAPTTRPRQSA